MASLPVRKSVIHLQSELHKFSDIRYAAYRTAAKLKFIQNYTNLHHVKLSNVLNAFEQMGLFPSERELLLRPEEICTLLTKLFQIAQKEVLFNLQVRQSSTLVRDLLTDVYDRSKTKSGCTVLCVQVFLTVLCGCGPLSEKYRCLLRLISNHNQCVAQRELALLLKALSSVAEFVNEGPAFGNWTVIASVQQCFEQSGAAGILTEDAVFAWLVREPQSLVWWSSLYRLNSAENVIHTVRCSACNTYPIQGLRYHCSDCFGYSQCQNCFWSGRVSKGHKLNHAMQEYCTQTTAKETTRTVLKKLKNLFSSRSVEHCQSSRYLPLKPQEKKPSESVLQVVNESEAIYEDLTFSNENADPNSTGLSSVIGRLVTEHGKLQRYVQQGTVPEPVLEHCEKLEAQLGRLQKIVAERKRENTAPPRRPPLLTRLESTPLLPVFKNPDQSLPFSPIAAGMPPSGKENTIPGPTRFESGRSSLRSGSCRVATNGTLNYCTPRLGRKSLQSTPRFTTEHTLGNLSRELAPLSNSTGHSENPFGESTDTQLSAELEDILAQLENLFPKNKEPSTVPENVTITKATRNVANAFAEFVDGFH